MPRVILDVPVGPIVEAIPAPTRRDRRILVIALWVNWTRNSSCATLEFLDEDENVLQRLHHSGNFGFAVWPPNPDGWFRQPPAGKALKLRWKNDENKTPLPIEIQWIEEISPRKKSDP